MLRIDQEDMVILSPRLITSFLTIEAFEDGGLILLIKTDMETCFMKPSLWEILKGSIMIAFRNPIPIIIVVEMLNSI